MSNIIPSIPIARPSQVPSVAVENEPKTSLAQDETPDEPQITVNSSSAEEPILAD